MKEDMGCEDNEVLGHHGPAENTADFWREAFWA